MALLVYTAKPKINSDVGHFDHAIKMNVDTFRQGMDLLDELTSDKPKDQEIYMYCTGGIRCSVAGAYLRNKGYQHVKMVNHHCFAE